MRSKLAQSYKCKNIWCVSENKKNVDVVVDVDGDVDDVDDDVNDDDVDDDVDDDFDDDVDVDVDDDDVDDDVDVDDVDDDDDVDVAYYVADDVDVDDDVDMRQWLTIKDFSDSIIIEKCNVAKHFICNGFHCLLNLVTSVLFSSVSGIRSNASHKDFPNNVFTLFLVICWSTWNLKMSTNPPIKGATDLRYVQRHRSKPNSLMHIVIFWILIETFLSTEFRRG